MGKITYEPINQDYPFTTEDLRTLYIKLAPLFDKGEESIKVIQIENSEA